MVEKAAFLMLAREQTVIGRRLGIPSQGIPQVTYFL
jgi:hypothetical protein